MHNKKINPHIICAAVCAFVFVCALIGTLLIYGAKPAGQIEIISHGELIYKGASVKRGAPVYIDAGNGENIVRIDEKGVCVESANCPDKDCVNSGYLKNTYLPIVCLPNELIIRYTLSGGAADSDEPDAISQ